MPHVDFPYRFDGRGRTAQTGDGDHVRDLIEQVLLTAPGERVMRPDFGAGLLQLVFEPNSVAVATTAQMLVQASLQQHLSHLIAVESVEIGNDDGALRVDIGYRLLHDDSVASASVGIPGGGA
ncbi:MAG: GPW/gp25 family protein [Luteimonas sp.]|nr:GPW/gp25 family protein [Luteimonas sp.]